MRTDKPLKALKPRQIIYEVSNRDGMSVADAVGLLLLTERAAPDAAPWPRPQVTG